MAKQESIFTKSKNLIFENISLRSQVETKDVLLKNYEEEISRLNEIVRDLQRSKFGKKSERWESSEQLVFNEAEAESLKPDPLGEDEESEGEITVKAHVKKGLGLRRTNA